MKRLAVLRHAKSSWADPGMADFDRPLNRRGRESARIVGREMARDDLRFDLVLASPARRVRETLDGIAAEYRISAEARFEPRIYEAATGTLVELVRALPDECATVLLAGHNPGLHELVLTLADRDHDGLRDRIHGNYPTGALAMVELDLDRWAGAKPGSGRISALILPRDLAD